MNQLFFCYHGHTELIDTFKIIIGRILGGAALFVPFCYEALKTNSWEDSK